MGKEECKVIKKERHTQVLNSCEELEKKQAYLQIKSHCLQGLQQSTLHLRKCTYCEAYPVQNERQKAGLKNKVAF